MSCQFLIERLLAWRSGGFYHKCSYEAQTSNIIKMFLDSTIPAIKPNRIYT